MRIEFDESLRIPPGPGTERKRSDRAVILIAKLP
jgi:hypothetical protein